MTEFSGLIDQFDHPTGVTDPSTGLHKSQPARDSVCELPQKPPRCRGDAERGGFLLPAAII